MPASFEFFHLKFRNITSGKTRDVKFLIDPHPLAQKWAGMLKEILSESNHLEKNYLLHGWLSGTRGVDLLCAELNRHIAVINKHYAKKPNNLSYHIDQVFDVLTVDQKELNRIHHDFEMLIGQVWNVSGYYQAAPAEVRHSIRQLNNLCHETESLLASQKGWDEGRCSSLLVTSFIPRRFMELTEEEKKNFRLFFGFGEVRLHYSQLGKTHLEAFYDKDNLVFDENITELRYLTGEFDISFTDYPHPDWADPLTLRFKTWLKSKGLDPEGPYGFARVAMMDFEQFKSTSSLEILRELFEYDDVCEISLFGDGVSYRKKYSYTWRDPVAERVQIHGASGPQYLKNFKGKILRAIFRNYI